MPQDQPRPPARRVDPSPDGPASAGLRLLVVPGVSPAKWLRVWQDRLPDVPVTLVHTGAREGAAVLLAGDAEAGLVRLPVDRTRLSAIPLYTETTVVVVPADHVLTAVDEVAPADLADEVLLVPEDDVVPWPDRPGRASATAAPATTAEAVELVAAGVGVLVVPQSLARLHHRRDLTYRPVLDAPTSTVALAWPGDRASDLVEELIGIVRGRTVNSSRGRAAPTAPAGSGAGTTSTSDAGRSAGRTTPGRAGRGRTGRGGTGRGGTGLGRGSGRSR